MGRWCRPSVYEWVLVGEWQVVSKRCERSLDKYNSLPSEKIWYTSINSFAGRLVNKLPFKSGWNVGISWSLMTSGSLWMFRIDWVPWATTTMSSIFAFCFAGDGTTATTQLLWIPTGRKQLLHISSHVAVTSPAGKYEVLSTFFNPKK